MDFRGVLVSGLAGAAGLLFLGSSSCSSVDPSTINFEARPKQDIVVGDASIGSSGDGGTGEGGTGDAGGEAGGPVTAFTGAPAYDATSAGMTTGSNQPAGHSAFTGKNPAGQACFDCHVAGSASGAPEFAIGGTINDAMAAGKALTTHAEVRIVDSAGKLVLSAYSDELGNVWTDPVTGGIPAGSSVGVRNGTVVKLMATKLTGPKDGNCSNTTCHGTGGNPGYLPFLAP